MEGRNCYADEHYLPTFFNVGTFRHAYSVTCFDLLYTIFVHTCMQMIDPVGTAKRSVTFVDWSERKWHPKSFKAQDITLKFLKNLTVRCHITLHFIYLP